MPSDAINERMHSIEMNNLWQKIGLVASSAGNILPIADLERLRDEFSHAEAIGPFIDPTAYLKIVDEIPGRRVLLDATIDYVKAVKPIIDAEIAKLEALKT